LKTKNAGKIDLNHMIYVVWIGVCMLCFTVLIVYQPPRTIVVEDHSGNQSSQQPDADTTQETVLLTFSVDSEVTGLHIPLQNSSWIKQVTIENRYMTNELWITLEQTDDTGANLSFYEENPLSGEAAGALTGQVERIQGGIQLKIRFPMIYEYKTTLVGNVLQVETALPSEIYDQIIVVDPAFGGEEAGKKAFGTTEASIALEIAKLLKGKLDQTKIKVYYTRLDDTFVDVKDRAALADRVGADFLISIATSFDPVEALRYGITSVYNGKYFIPEFGNVDLADLIEREVVTAVTGKAEGLYDVYREMESVENTDLPDHVLFYTKIPAMQLRVGYLSNWDENILLQKSKYQEKIADGIISAILKAYEFIETLPSIE
jgi:N-acetylmuramoyl-L-alanine amidase